MSDSQQIVAAGAVVWRDRGDGIEVAVVHRPKYDDWSFPKGKLKPGEIPAVAAVREVHEETGLRVRLGARLPLVRYETSAGPKIVWYWVATADAAAPREPDHEVDEVVWLPATDLGDRLSYQHDRSALAEAMSLRQATSLVVVRHATAVARECWPGDDRARPLDPAGQAESLRLKVILEPWNIGRLVTSPALRCLDTIQPYAGSRGMTVCVAEELTEEVGEHDPAAVLAFLRGLLADGDNTLICTHRPLLVLIADAFALGLAAEDRRDGLPPAGFWFLYLRSEAPPKGLPDDLASAVLGVERYSV